MIFLPTYELYYSTQVYFRKHFIDDLPNDDKVWEQEYHKWLATQGATIVKTKKIGIIRNSLGVAPYYDEFGFENDQDATMFILRWS
jgi:hypothetical protein